MAIQIPKFFELYKEESLEIQHKDFFDIILGWDGCCDIDLCAFYKKKSGQTGGVFTNMYNHQKHTEGSLSGFPFIFLMGEGRISPKYNEEEIIRIASIHEMEEVYIVAIDYNATIEDETGFAQSLTLETTGTNPFVTISYSRPKYSQGTILLLAILTESNNGSLVITNKSKLMALPNAFMEIPGFKSIVAPSS